MATFLAENTSYLEKLHVLFLVPASGQSKMGPCFCSAQVDGTVVWNIEEHAACCITLAQEQSIRKNNLRLQGEAEQL
jgi:hypothetical protein